VLLSTGLVGSWFFSCASINVRKSVPPNVAPLVIDPEPPAGAEPVPPTDPAPVPVPVPVPMPVVAAACVPIIVMIYS
jgi:hypothetical protein